MRSISQIHDFILNIFRKERGGMIPHAQIDAALYAGLLETVTDYFRLFGINGEVHDCLVPFKTSAQFTSNSTGLMTYPSDCMHSLTIYTVSGSTIYKVRMVQEDELADAINSQLRPVSVTKPLGRDTNGGIQLYPQTTQLGTILYLKTPSQPVFGYSQVGRVITYNPNTSTQLEVSDVYVDKVISKALEYLGIGMSEKAIIEFGAAKDKEA